MALIVEDGSGKADAEAYADVAYADKYLADRGYANWSTLTVTDKEGALRRATDYMARWRGRWRGARRIFTQALDWPRVGVQLDDFHMPPGYGYGAYQVDYQSVPPEVLKACAELAYRAAQGELSEDLDRATASETVGSISVSYLPGASRTKRYTAVESLLSPLFETSGNTVQVERA